MPVVRTDLPLALLCSGDSLSLSVSRRGSHNALVGAAGEAVPAPLPVSGGGLAVKGYRGDI